MRNLILVILFIFVLSMPSHSQTTSVACLNNQTVNLTINQNVCVDSVCDLINTNEIIKCPYGCDNKTGGSSDCRPDPTDVSFITFLPPFALALLAFFFLYIAMNMKRYEMLQFLFLGFSMFIMIGNAWFVYNQAQLLYAQNISNVFITIYQGTIVTTIIVIFYFILTVLYTAWKNAQNRKHGIWTGAEEG